MTGGAVWVGVDLGTQSVRALVVADDGEIAGSGSCPLASRRERERHEQDPEQWWQAVGVACREALRDVAPQRVGAVATCGTSGTIVLVDPAGAPLTPALMYDDGRATRQARRASDALGRRIPPSWALAKLLWLLERRADAGARLAHQPDLVNRRLAGRAVRSDSSHALKSGYDLVAGAWPRPLLEELGVPAGVLPDVVRSGTRLGVVCAEAAAHTAIPVGTPVIAGMTDGCAGQLASGALLEGQWNSVLGTTLVLKGVSHEPISDPDGVVYSHRAPDGAWLPGGASSSGAGVLSAAFGRRDLDELGRRAAEHERTSVLAYPLLGRGERFPFVAPHAHGFLLGEPAGDGEHFASLLQGLAFVERLCFDYLDRLGAPTGGELSLTGGATRSRYWCQLRADVLGRPVRLVEQPEAAFGMAILAASAGDELAGVAAGMVRTREIIEPRPDRVDAFTERYVRLVDELERRGWLGRDLAEHARTKAAR